MSQWFTFSIHTQANKWVERDDKKCEEVAAAVVAVVGDAKISCGWMAWIWIEWKCVAHQFHFNLFIGHCARVDVTVLCMSLLT